MQTSNRPLRLHHHAAVVRDLAATREFYTELLGLEHVATWCERTADGHDFCHAFFELEDRSCLAFFQFAEDEQYQAQKKPEGTSTYHHVALLADEACQQEMARRVEAAGQESIVIDHGYCRSLYVRDPDGHVVEVTVDEPGAVRDAASHRHTAESELKRWLDGDHRDNNTYRKEAPEVTGR